MNKKIIFVDLDGTLFDVPRGMKEASLKSRYAISQLIKNGYLVFIASGRARCLMPKYILDLNPSGLITTNGACAFDGDKVIFKETIDEESIKLVDDFCRSHNGVMYLECQDYIYSSYKDSKLHKAFVEAWGIDDSPMQSERDPNESYQMMMSVFEKDTDCDLFEEAMKGKVDYRKQYGFTSFDISNNYINKGYAVKKVLDYYHINSNDAYAFGDGLNDLEFLKEVGNSFCMENGHEKVKAIAKHIAKDVLEDGFYNSIVELGFIKPI